jgi:hypothetical protein
LAEKTLFIRACKSVHIKRWAVEEFFNEKSFLSLENPVRGDFQNFLLKSD